MPIDGLLDGVDGGLLVALGSGDAGGSVGGWVKKLPLGSGDAGGDVGGDVEGDEDGDDDVELDGDGEGSGGMLGCAAFAELRLMTWTTGTE